MSATDQDVLLTIIRGELGDQALVLEPGTVIRDLPGIESMKVLRIISKIEKQFGVELDDDVVFNIGTYGELVGALEKAKAEASR